MKQIDMTKPQLNQFKIFNGNQIVRTHEVKRYTFYGIKMLSYGAIKIVGQAIENIKESEYTS